MNRTDNAGMGQRASCAVRACAPTKLLLLLAAMFASGMAAPCLAASIRGEVLLEGPSIHVGDIFSDAGARTGDVIGPAPAPGRKVVYDVSSLIKVAQLFGVEYTPAGNYERVEITRASEAFTGKDALALVQDEIARSAPGRVFDLALDHSSLEIHRPKGEKPEIKLADFSFDSLKYRFEGSLMVGRTASADVEIIKISGRAMPMLDVAVLQNNLPAGSTIGSGDVEWKKVPQDKAGADALTDAARLPGLETRRTLSTGSILRLRDVRGARLVVKGALVSIIVETPSMLLATQGRALGDAEYGETVRILNTQSNRTIDAVVIGSNRVSAALGGPANAQVAAVR